MDSSGQRRAERDGSSAWRRRESDGCAHGGDTSSSRSRWLWQHHSAQKSAGPVSHNVLRNQNTAREGTEYYAMSEDSDVVHRHEVFDDLLTECRSPCPPAAPPRETAVGHHPDSRYVHTTPRTNLHAVP